MLICCQQYPGAVQLTISIDPHILETHINKETQ